MMGAATVVESLRGTEAALKAVYHNPVFIALWAVTAVAGIIYVLQMGMLRRAATFTLHIAFVVILAGALITHYAGKSGSIHLKEGEPLSEWELEDGTSAPLPFSLTLRKFTIDYYPGSKDPRDYRSDVEVDGEPAVISMNKILKKDGYRFFQADYDEDLSGSILAVSRDPAGVLVTYAGYLLLLLSMIAFFFEKQSGFRRALRRLRENGRSGAMPVWVLVALIVLAALILAYVTVFGLRGKHLLPVLRSPLLPIHVISIMLSYTLLAITMGIGIVSLISGKKEKRKDISLVFLYPAVFLLAFGIFVGAVWANISWGGYWGWDPKETWALVTMLLYSAALHAGPLGGVSRRTGRPPFFRNPTFFHIYIIAAFLAVLITWFGVNYLLGGMHSYA